MGTVCRSVGWTPAGPAEDEVLDVSPCGVRLTFRSDGQTCGLGLGNVTVTEAVTERFD